MNPECFPITALPHVTPLYRAYVAMADAAKDAAVRRWYGAEPFGNRWIGHPASVPHAARLADLLEAEADRFSSSPSARANIELLRNGARAVVTGQQVVLFGGPLLTLLKAATAIARAKEATTATGIPHVPVFWMATEDHDLAEVDQVSLLTKTSVETLRAHLRVTHAVPVGSVTLGSEIDAVLDHATELLAYAPITETLRACYAASESDRPTLALAFGRLIAHIFADQGLIVMDAASRPFHALGASVLRYAIEDAADLQASLISRSRDLTDAGFHAQVLVNESGSLLFLLDETTGERQALRRTGSGAEAAWKAGGRTYTTADLLAILEAAPERLSPNALLRPVFQDALLPTAAYVGGPAEIAYFAQSAVLYQTILGRITPVLPRLSATLLEPAIATVMDKDEVQLPDAFTTPDALAQRLGARAMPIEAKRRIAAAGNAAETELEALTTYLSGMDASLGRSAEVSASKIRYQLSRLRRMAATFQLQKETSLRKHADAIVLNVFPNAHPQERVVAGVWYLAQYGEGLIDRLVAVAANQCPGHVIIRL